MHLILVYTPIGDVPHEDVSRYLEVISRQIGKLPNSKIWFIPVGEIHPKPSIRVEVYDIEGDVPEDAPEPMAAYEILSSAEKREPQEPQPASGSLETIVDDLRYFLDKFANSGDPKDYKRFQLLVEQGVPQIKNM